MSRTGRRPGTPDTRETILTVARRRFATRGYDATSVRAIATEAEVDPALVIHYFGTKEALFIAAAGLPPAFPSCSGTWLRSRTMTSAGPSSAATCSSSTATIAATASSLSSARRCPTTKPPPCCGSS